MSLLSLIFTLLLEQVRPVNPRAFPFDAFLRWADAVARNFNAGRQRHGLLGWVVAIAPWVILANLGHVLLADTLYGLGSLVWSTGVLYLVLGMRQFSHGFTVVHDALREGRTDEARTALGRWSDEVADEYTGTEIAKSAIERGIVAAHRHVFGVMAWFVIVPAVLGTVLPGVAGLFFCGPGGAVLYRLATLLDERWGRREDALFADFGQFARDAMRWLDWLPVRLTALSFAIVGDFEDAVFCWRAQASGWIDRQMGIVLASGAGALGVRLGEALHRGGTVVLRPELGLGDEVDTEHLNSAIGMIWRALVLWVLVITLVTIASHA